MAKSEPAMKDMGGGGGDVKVSKVSTKLSEELARVPSVVRNMGTALKKATPRSYVEGRYTLTAATLCCGDSVL